MNLWCKIRSKSVNRLSGGVVLFADATPLVRVHQGEVHPQWFGPRDFRWLEVLLERLQILHGRPRWDVERILQERPERGETARAWQAAVRLALQCGRFEPEAALSPMAARAAVFGAGHHHATANTRAATLAAVASELGVSQAELERSLYADLPSARVFKRVQPVPSLSVFVDKLNMAIGQSILRRAEVLHVHVRENLEAILRMVRITRLLCWAKEPPNGELGAVLCVSGPLALFRHTTLYGRSMAAWLPLLTRTRGFRLCATCNLGGQRVRWHVDHTSPLASQHEDPLLKRCDSAVEARLLADIVALAPDFEVLREASVVQVGARFMVPDFVLRSRPCGRQVAVEIVGFWTPKYLAHKVAALQAVAGFAKWIVCVDTSLALDARVLPHWPILSFRKIVRAAELLALVRCELGLATPAGPSPPPRASRRRKEREIWQP